jgi:hypothetical protein
MGFGVHFNPTRAYTAHELRLRLVELYENVYKKVKGAVWLIFLPKDFALRVNFVR